MGAFRKKLKDHFDSAFFSSAHFVYKKLIKPKSKNEDGARREYILNLLLLGSLILMLVAFLIVFFNQIKEGSFFRGIPPIIIFPIVLFFSFLLYASRKKHPLFSAYIFIWFLFLFSVFMIFKWGLDAPGNLVFVILTIIFSGIVINSRFAFILSLIFSLFLVFINYLHLHNIVQPDFGWKTDVMKMSETSAIVIILVIMAVVSWLSNRETSISLKRARKSEKELRREKDNLQMKIEEKTRELKNFQMKQMAQIYRFSEFGKISSGLFHDLINHLTAVSLNVEQTNLKNTNQTKSYLEKAIRAATNMQGFISAIKKQISYQKEKEKIFLEKEIKQIIQLFSYKLRKENVEVKFKSANQDIFLWGNSVKFDQIISNLITNAIDAYKNIEKSKKEIEISLAEKENRIILTVQDWGCGIKPENIDKIFEPFFSAKISGEGIGIGLSLVKEIAEKDFRGSVGVESKENQGAKFIVNFLKKDGK